MRSCFTKIETEENLLEEGENKKTTRRENVQGEGE
jgi:hypothetical protein